MAMTISSNVVEANGHAPVMLPDGAFAAEASFMRSGNDLYLTDSQGETVIVEDYFALTETPDLVTPEGARLTPELVEAFLPPQHVGQYADADGWSTTDESPVAQVENVKGNAWVIRADGTKHDLEDGFPVFEGDIIETDGNGAVSLIFADNTNFAVSENARLSIDEFVYNAEDGEGSSFFSMLRGVFVYTSGLIGKDDPGNVNIETPVGSIGIRGTVIAGHINPAGQDSQITIIDGAVVITNATGSIDLDATLETAVFGSYTTEPVNVGQIDAATAQTTYGSVSDVSSGLYSAVTGEPPAGETQNDSQSESGEAQQTAPATETPAEASADTPPPPPVLPDGPLGTNTESEPAESFNAPGDQSGEFVVVPPQNATEAPRPPAGHAGGDTGSDSVVPNFAPVITTDDINTREGFGPGEIVGQIKAVDGNFGDNAGLKFSLTNSAINANTDFAVTQNGLIKYVGDGSPKDFLTDGNYQIEVQVDDGRGENNSVTTRVIDLNIDSLAADGDIWTVLTTSGNDSIPGHTIFTAPSVDDQLLLGLDGDDVISAGEGQNDTLLGGLGNDELILHDDTVTSTPVAPTFNLIDGGQGGVDTLVISGINNLDLTNSQYDGRVQNIERVNLHGPSNLSFGTGGASTLTLNFEDLIEMTDQRNELRIDGQGTVDLSHFVGNGISVTQQSGAVANEAVFKFSDGDQLATLIVTDTNVTDVTGISGV